MRALRHTLVLFTAILLAALPAAFASASETAWWYNRAPVAEGQTVEVATGGSLTFNLREPGSVEVVSVKCAVAGVNAFWNLPGAGVGEVQQLALTACSSEKCPEPAITAAEVPWSFTLFGFEQPLAGEIRGMTLEARCAGVSTRYSGTVVAEVGDPDEQCEGTDELDDEARFIANREDPNVLAGPEGKTLRLLGSYKFGSKTLGVTGEVRPCLSKNGPESK